MTPKEERALRRDVEAAHDAVEDELAPLKAAHDEIEAKLAPLLDEQRRIEAKMDALKAPLHGKRLELAGKLKAREDAKKAADPAHVEAQLRDAESHAEGLRAKLASLSEAR